MSAPAKKGLARASSVKNIRPGGPAPLARSNAVAELIDAIIKKKTFKQLAGYSIKCLQDLLQPGRMGWELQARAAFEQGGIRAVADVLLKYPTDSELQHFGLSACKSMISAPGTGAADIETLAISVQLVETLWATDMGNDAEKAQVMVEALEYFQGAARKGASSVAGCGVMEVLEAMAGKLAAGWGGDACAQVAAAISRLVHAMTSGREGLLAVTGRVSLLTAVLDVSLAVYNRYTVTAAAAAAGVAAKPGGRAGRGVDTGLALRTAVDPVLRILDRVSRGQDGVKCLATLDALVRCLPFADYWLHASDARRGGADAGSSSSSSSSGSGKGGAGGKDAKEGGESFLPASAVLELTNRLVGGDADRLLRIAAGSEGGVSGDGRTRQQAARLLARIVELPDRAASVAKDAALLAAVVATSEDAIREQDESGATDLTVSTAMLAVLLRVGERGGAAGITSVLNVGALPAALAALTVALVQPVGVASDTCAAAALRLVHLSLTTCGDWRLNAAGTSLAEGAGEGKGGGEGGLTLLEYLVAYDAGEAAHPQYLPHRYGSCAPPPVSEPALVRLLSAAVLSAGEGGFPPPLSLSPSSPDMPPFAAKLSLSFFGLALLRDLAFTVTEAPQSTAHVGLTRASLSHLAAPVVSAVRTFSLLLAAGVGEGTAEDGGLGWLLRSSATLALNVAVTLADDGPSTAHLLQCGLAESLVSLLQGGPLEGSESAAAAKAYAQKLRSAKTAGASASLRGGAAASAGGAGDGSSPVVLGAGWLMSLATDAPSWAIATFAKPSVLAADALYAAASLMAYLAAHSSGEPGDADRVPQGVISAIGPLAAAADIERAKAATGNAATVQGAVSCMLQAALVTYALYSSDATVYANFRDMVDVAGVSGEEVIAAVETVRGAAIVMRQLLLDAPTRASSVTGGNTAAASAFKAFASAWDGSDMAALDARDAAGAKAAEAAVRARLAASGVSPNDYLGSMWEAATLARQKLLLLEAISLSGFLSWGIVVSNGVLHLLRVVEVLSSALATSGDLDAVRLSKLPSHGSKRKEGELSHSLLLGRVDDTLSHAVSTLSHLCRVAYEVRASGAYAVEGDGDDALGACGACDKRLVPEVLFGPEVTRVVCASIPAVLASPGRSPLFVAKATLLVNWLAAASTITPRRGDAAVDPGWAAKYVRQLVTAEFTEGVAGLFRTAVASLTAAVAAAARGGSGGGGGDASSGAGAARARFTGGAASAASSSASSGPVSVEAEYDTVTSLLGALQYLGASKPGAEAIVTRGASRVIMRAVPFLLAQAGSDRSPSSPPYRALTALLRVLYGAIVSGGTTSSHAGEDGEAMSVGGLMQKQGVVPLAVTIVFSPVGITSAASVRLEPGSSVGGPLAGFAVFGEACATAMAIVSSVATRKDVTDSVARLYDVCGTLSDAITGYIDASQAEAEAWSMVAATGSAAGQQLRHAVPALGDLAGGGGSGGGSGSGGGEEGGEESQGASASSLLGAVQLFGVLAATDAGRKCGAETAAQGIAACLAVAQSAQSYVVMASRVQEAVGAAVASVTASLANADADGKGAAGGGGLPTSISQPAAAALGALGRGERELLWCIQASCQASQLGLMTLLDTAAAAANSAGGGMSPYDIDDDSEADPLTVLAGSSEFLQSTLTSLPEQLLGLVELASGPSLAQLQAAAGGALAEGIKASSAGGGARAKLGIAGGSSSGSGASSASANGAPLVPSPDSVLGEAAAALSLACLSRCAAGAVPSACENRGVAICLGAMSGAGRVAGDGAKGPGGAASGGGEGGSGGGGEEAGGSSGAPLEVLCHVLGVLKGVAGSSEAMVPYLAQCGVTQAVLRGLWEVMGAASAAAAAAGVGGGATPEEAHRAGDRLECAVGGVTSACGVLTSLCLAGSTEVAAMLTDGLTSYMTSAIDLCGDDDSAPPAGGGVPPRPPLLRSQCRLLTRLAINGGVLYEDEGYYAVATRELLAKALSAGSNGRPYIESVATMTALFRCVLGLGQPGGYVTDSAAARVIAVIKESVPGLPHAVRRSMANSSATPSLISLGRQVLALLGEEDMPVSGGDEVMAAVTRARSLVDVLYEMFEEGLTGGGSDEGARLPQLEEVCDSLRALALVIMPHFRVAMEGAAPDDDGPAPSTPTSASVSLIFGVARDYVLAATALAAHHAAAPSSPRLASSLLDVVSACLPIVARMAVFAEAARQALLASYWAGGAPDWQLAPEGDAPLVEVVRSLLQALDVHIVPAERTLAVGGGGDGSPGSGPAAYAPLPACVEGVCQTLRHVVAGAGSEVIGALASAGALAKLSRLQRLLGSLGERGLAPSSATDRCASALSSAVRFIVSKAWSEMGVYSQGAGDRDALAVLPAPALKEILRASARAAVLAGGAGGAGEPDGDEVRSCVASLASCVGGPGAVFAVLEQVAADTLAAAKLAAPLAPGGECEPVPLGGGTLEARVQLRLFAALLATVAERRLPVPATLGALRGLYGAVLSSLAGLGGDAFTAPLLASATTSLYREPAALEHVPEAERAKDCEDTRLWAVKPGAAHLAADDARVEDV